MHRNGVIQCLKTLNASAEGGRAKRIQDFLVVDTFLQEDALARIKHRLAQERRKGGEEEGRLFVVDAHIFFPRRLF